MSPPPPPLKLNASCLDNSNTFTLHHHHHHHTTPPPPPSPPPPRSMRLAVFLHGDWGNVVLWVRVAGPPDLYNAWDPRSQFVRTAAPPAQWGGGTTPDPNFWDCFEILGMEDQRVLMAGLLAAMWAQVRPPHGF
ncbi:uncharacterized protein RCC_07970 [Ramularia collo-cygni]|uniref:Uncharacterized protein n=1 Tax=Ramularia collo-cygni TaxID=112498 RepID=A0A2D3UYW5_9PEZI|nr:uncharacterized protein RCC_07970 [Ramularia collo-cygni]CZT22101.1 uncharacterized protein RCC_07970 [Ramularia collo-cygni]